MVDCTSHDGILYVSVINNFTPNLGNPFKVNVTTAQQKNGFVTLYPHFNTRKGYYFTLTDVYSPQLDNLRDVLVYLPPSCLENGLDLGIPLLSLKTAKACSTHLLRALMALG